QSASPDQLAALDEESELARCHANDVTVLAPRTCESPALKPFLKNAKARAVPHQDLAPSAPQVDEQVQVSAERVSLDTLLDHPEQAVVALAQIDRLRLLEDAYRPAGAEDHPSARSTAIASSSDS